MQNKKILVTGGTGMLGKHLQMHFPNFSFIGSSNYDLRNSKDAVACFEQYKPNIVIHAAAKVGGVIANSSQQYDFFYDNLMINTNVINEAIQNKIEYLMCFSSSCTYPKDYEEYPMQEHSALDGPPEPTNFGYAHSKRMLKIQLEAAKEQFGFKNWSILYLTNLYGPYDCFDLYRSHVVAALLRKFYLAKKNNEPSVNLRGTGTPLRQLLYITDLVKIIDFFVNNRIRAEVNVANHEVFSIKQIADIVINTVEYNGKVDFIDNLDGVYRKDLDNKNLLNYMPNMEFTNFKTGIKNTYNWLLNTDLDWK